MIRFFALSFVLAAATFADDTATRGRQVLTKYQDTVLTVRTVVNYTVSYSGRDQQSESKSDTIGTVIDPSGLTVISLSAIDPSAMLKARQRGRQADMKVDSEVKDVRLVLPDGTEIAAEVVLRDKDLDLAFIRPTEKPAKSFTAVDLAHAGKPQVLDEVICLNRLSKIASHIVSVSLERVDAVVERPRPFYVLASGGTSGIGSPAFTLTGDPVGVMVIRNSTQETEANATSMFSGWGGLGIMPVILPASDILEDAKQAMEAKKPAPPEKK
jgi:hypothetical protein